MPQGNYCKSRGELPTSLGAALDSGGETKPKHVAGDAALHGYRLFVVFAPGNQEAGRHVTVHTVLHLLVIIIYGVLRKHNNNNNNSSLK